MTFFYDLNKRLAQLADKQDLHESKVAESEKWIQKAVNPANKGNLHKALHVAQDEKIPKAKIEKATHSKNPKLRHMAQFAKNVAKEDQEVEESAFQAAIGKKKYGDQGMKALQKAGRDHAGKEKMAKIRAKYDKYDESMEEGILGFGLPKFTVDRDYLSVDSGMFQHGGNQAGGKKLMAALQKANPQLAAQGKHYGASGPDGYMYMGIQFPTPQLAQQAAQALQGGMEEGNAFTDELRKTPKGGKFKMGNKEYTDTSDLEEGFKEMDAWLASREKEKGTGKFDKKERTLPGGMKATTYTRKHDDEEDKDDDKETSSEPKRRGRPKSAKSKDSERVTKGSHKYKTVDGKRVKKEKTKEDLDSDGVLMTRPTNCSSESIDHDMEGSRDRDESGEFGAEGDYVKNELHTMVRVARDLEKHLRDNEDLPTWCIGKLSQAKGMVVSVMDYIMSEKERGIEANTGAEGISIVPEVAPPGAKAERMVKGIKKSLSKDGHLSGKDKAIAYATTWKARKAGKVEEEGAKPDFLDVDKDGNKKETFKKAVADKKDKKEDKVDETTVAGSVATAPATTKKSSGGMQFGKGVYEGFNNQVESMITESINVADTIVENEGKTITVTASGPEADMLMQLLKAAGLSGQSSGCGCGQTPCACDDTVEEAYGDTDETLNDPDWPTDTETLAADPELRTYSGGLNGPKSTGQTTVPVIASQLRRQTSMEENVELERNLFKTWKNYKG